MFKIFKSNNTEKKEISPQKKRKIIIWSAVGIAALAVCGTLLGVFIPKLLAKKTINPELEKNQVIPSEGKGNFLNYSTIADLPEDEKVKSINDFANRSLINEQGMNEYIYQTISNILVDFFQNIQNSAADEKEFDNWIKEIDESFDDKVKSYQDQYKDDWGYYFQLEVLDPVGGNENDYKRKMLFEKVNTKFDTYVNQNTYINLVDKTTNKPITNVTEEMLFSDNVVFNNIGQPCNIKFIPSNSSDQNFQQAFADLQSFIFDEYVKAKLPIVTSMVLFKHEAPVVNGVSDYFNVGLATKLNANTDPIGVDPNYCWPVFNPEVFNSDGTWNATAKYNNFIKDYNDPNAYYGPIIWDQLGGAININTVYTDDSATLYLINANDVFSTSYTQYAAAAIYKLNNLLWQTTDPNVPVASSFLTGFNNKPGTEIMSNFFNLNSGYSFNLPETIKSVLLTDPQYRFDGRYNGVEKIADTVNIDNSPFIMTRDEAGVHIIGIDRYSAISSASDYEQKITEIKNTLLWRNLISSTVSSSNAENVTGFNMDLGSEIKNFYSEHRNEILIKYIIKKETQNPKPDANDKTYIFSNAYSNMKYPMNPNTKELINQNERDLFNKYFDYIDYKNYEGNNQLVKEKVLGLQANYVGKSFGNPQYNDAVITNGMAGILPYSRNITENAINGSVYNNVYGTYDYLNWRFSDGQMFENTTLNNKKTLFEQQVSTFLINNFSGNFSLVPKALTFSTSAYNQYLQIGNKTSTSTNYYADSGQKINMAVFKWIESGEIKNVVVNQKIQQYLKEKNAGINDNNNFLISEQAKTISTLPKVIPSANDNSSVSFINAYLQYAQNIINNVSKTTSESYQSYGSWTSFDSLYDLLLKTKNADIQNGYYTSTQQDNLKNFITLLYAFDYNETTNAYDFTKFRDYLLESTDNYNKAAFVWTTKDKVQYIQDYGTSLQSDFSFKPKMFNIIKNTFGYGYIDAANNVIQPMQDGQNKLKFANDVTFNDNQSYWNYVSPTKDLNSKYTGYTGMQFQGDTTSDLDQEYASIIFGNSAKYIDKTNPKQYKAKGALYNLANNKADGMKILDKEMDRIANNGQKIGMLNWLDQNFPVTNDDPNKTQIDELRKKVLQEYNPSAFLEPLKALANLMIPDYAFERVENDQLANTKNVVQQPNSIKYFGDVRNMASQVVVTQFNHQDVIELFNTDLTPDPQTQEQVIDEKDKGINWSVANQKGFLGVGADAFFFSAYQWAVGNGLYTNKSFKEMQKFEGKINTFDRRLNNLFGEEWVENYKKSN